MHELTFLYTTYVKPYVTFVIKATLVISVLLFIVGVFFQKNNTVTQNNVNTNPNITLKKTYEDFYALQPKSTTEALIINSVAKAHCGLFGILCSNNPNNYNEDFKSSLFGGLTSLVTLPYGAPVSSGIVWAQQGLANAGFIPNTYAATGLGLVLYSH